MLLWAIISRCNSSLNSIVRFPWYEIERSRNRAYSNAQSTSSALVLQDLWQMRIKREVNSLISRVKTGQIAPSAVNTKLIVDLWDNVDFLAHFCDILKVLQPLSDDILEFRDLFRLQILLKLDLSRWQFIELVGRVLSDPSLLL